MTLVPPYKYDFESKDFADWIEALRQEVNHLELESGWATYQDTTFTEGSPFSVSADTFTQVPFNKDVVDESELPEGIGTWMEENSDGAALAGIRVGDAYVVTFSFKCKPTTTGTHTLAFVLSIPGEGESYRGERVLAKGSGVEHNFVANFSVNVDQAFLDNGAQFYVEADSAFEMYAMKVQVIRAHHARS